MGPPCYDLDVLSPDKPFIGIIMMRSGVVRRSCIVYSIQKPIRCQENYRRISAGKGGKEAVKGIPGPGRGLEGIKPARLGG
jgi:hypothetical protein